MDEIVNPQDLLLEIEGLRKELRGVTQSKDKLQKINLLFSHSEQFVKVGYWEWDEIADQYITCSEQYAKIIDMTVAQLMGELKNNEEDRESVCENDRERYNQVVDSAVESKQGWDIKYSSYTKAGRWLYLHEIGKPVLDDHGVLVKTIGTIQDITKVRALEEELKQSNTLYRQAEAMGNMGHFYWDLTKDKLISCSDQFARIYGMTVPEALECFVNIDAVIDLIHPDDKERFRQGTRFHNEQRNGNDFEYRVTLSGNTRHLYVRREILLDNNGEPLQAFGIVQDITESKHAEEKLKRIAHYDVLTNLPNRVLLADRLNHAMAQCQRRNQSLAVAYMDLDGFKVVNDTYGHDLGDKLLVELSKRMKETLREGDTLARIGGDEFIAIMVGLEKIKDSEPALKRCC
jgi:PAS domain S-box-containing protein